MNGDKYANGTTRAANLASASPNSVVNPDTYYLRGLLFDHEKLSSDATFEYSQDWHDYWAQYISTGPAGPVVNGTAGLSQHNAIMLRENDTKTGLTSGGTARAYSREVTSQYHTTYGIVQSVNDTGDPVNGSGVTCTITNYAVNATTWLVDYPAYVGTFNVACPAGAGVQPPAGNRIARRDYFYDADYTTAAAPPAAGNATRIIDWTSSGTTIGHGYSYDSAGRVTGAIAPSNFNTAATTFAT